jgi:asparagine synthase (glutamine-hydrolysing)
MCGITGMVAFNERGKPFLNFAADSIKLLNKRGPDNSGTFFHKNTSLAHSRLSIIDISNAARQPFTDSSGRYTIVFNGEFFNYKEQRKALELKGVHFVSTGDTEVLLQLYIHEGPGCLNKVNGFFAFAIYDSQDASLFLARDRSGIKPLLYYQDADKFIFASEMKAILAYKIQKEIDPSSLLMYMRLNYIPAPDSIFKGVKKVMPGTSFSVKDGNVTITKYYTIPTSEPDLLPTYDVAKNTLNDLLKKSVSLRMVSDVPLGAFLSGGIDSSILVALASANTKKLNTFSIGFKDEPLFDETKYARLVADKYKTEHTVFSLTNEDLYASLNEVLDYIDEPFADSSALLVFILSMNTRKYVKVALSGDGADELFAGYNKHQAAFRIQQGGLVAKLLKWTGPLWNILPKSRNSTWGNVFRKFDKFATGMQLSDKERYWEWAGFISDEEARSILKDKVSTQFTEYNKRKQSLLSPLQKGSDINDFLRADMNLVLPNDMLTKVDLMSMANGLEVRTPFLDYRIVDFAFSIPASYKIDANDRKKILKDAFKDILPPELLTRGKQGFEVPLLKWFRTELKSLITDNLLNDRFIEEQGIFELKSIQDLKLKLFSSNVEEAVGQIWGLIVFQYWWKKYMQ